MPFNITGSDRRSRPAKPLDLAPFVLLGGTLIIVLLSSLLSLRAAARHQTTATRALNGFARLAAWNFASRLYLRLTSSRPTYVGAVESGSATATATDLNRLRLLDDSLDDCDCHAHIDALGFASGRMGRPESVRYLAASGQTPIDTATRMRQLREIADTVLPAQAAVLFGAPKDSSTAWLFVIFPLFDREGRAESFVALDADLGALQRRVIADLFASTSVVLPEELIGGSDVGNADVAQVVVSTRKGGELFRSSPAYTTGYRATVPVGRDGALLVTLELSPFAAGSILQGTLPSSGWRTTIILAVLGTLLLTAIALTLRRAQSLARQRSEFAASVTHELRTPLTQILLNAETLQYGRVRSPSQQEPIVSAIVRESRRLVYLLENVLHFSRVERGLLRLTRQPVRLDLFAAEHVDDLQSLLATAGVQVEVDAPTPASGMADADVLALVLTNVLMNAVHHAPGSPVRLSVRESDGQVEYLVDDHGPGIPARERERVQRPFVRGSQAVASHPTGSGLGLAVSRELMAAMGGKLALEDAPGGGLRVRLTFERTAAREAPVGVPS
jgi:signal transduction histidine kinase